MVDPQSNGINALLLSPERPFQPIALRLLMQGCTRLWILLVIFSLAGCTEGDEKTPAPAKMPLVQNESFDESATGTITGKVSWQGDLPKVEPFKVYGLPGEYKF